MKVIGRKDTSGQIKEHNLKLQTSTSRTKDQMVKQILESPQISILNKDIKFMYEKIQNYQAKINLLSVVIASSRCVYVLGCVGSSGINIKYGEEKIMEVT